MTMPYFFAYDYVFALDVLKVPLSVINMQGFILGNLNFLIPWLYQKYYVNRDYVDMFLVSQHIFVMAEAMGICMALQINKKIGIPNVVLYLLSGKVAQIFMMGFHAMPSYMIYSKLVPKGVESTMTGITFTFVSLNLGFLRESLGMLINDHFVHVTNKDLHQYVWLKVIAMMMNCISYIFYAYGMIPTRAEADEL